MQKLTKEQALIISAYTGFLICDFGDVHEEIEKRLGRPVFTHELPGLTDEIQKIFHADFIAMAPQ